MPAADRDARIRRLRYAEPTERAEPADDRRRFRAKHVAAKIFAVAAVGLGSLGVFGSGLALLRNHDDLTTRDRTELRSGSIRTFVCGVLLIVPGVLYGRLGFRGETSADGDESPGFDVILRDFKQTPDK